MREWWAGSCVRTCRAVPDSMGLLAEEGPSQAGLWCRPSKDLLYDTQTERCAVCSTYCACCPRRGGGGWVECLP